MATVVVVVMRVFNYDFLIVVVRVVAMLNHCEGGRVVERVSFIGEVMMRLANFGYGSEFVDVGVLDVSGTFVDGFYNSSTFDSNLTNNNRLGRVVIMVMAFST